jgi:hypothetical protein
VARQGTELTRESLRASVQPWLTIGDDRRIPTGDGPSFVDGRIIFTLDANDLQAVIRIKNVGNGMAVVDPSSSHLVGVDRDGQPVPFVSCTIDDPIVLPDRQMELIFKMNFVQCGTTWDEMTASGPPVGGLRRSPST